MQFKWLNCCHLGLLSLFDDHDESVEMIKPFVGALLRELLVLIKETENDDIADALRDIIRIYGSFYLCFISIL